MDSHDPNMTCHKSIIDLWHFFFAKKNKLFSLKLFFASVLSVATKGGEK